MAGAGYRTWVPGEVITADNVQQYLQDQAVQVYADSTARGTALTGYIAEGMVSYLEDTNAVEVYDGSSWVGLGGDAPIFTSGTAGLFLKSLGTAGVQWDSVPTPGSATPTTAGIVVGRTEGTTDTSIVALGYNAASSAVVDPLVVGSVGIGPNAFAIGTGGGNTAIGVDVLAASTSGILNTGVGFSALRSNTSGGRNTAIGNLAGYDTTTGSNNTSIGNDARPTSASASNEITLGNSSVSALRCQVTSITSLSDQRDKKDIQDLPAGLDFINDLRPVRFTWNTRIPETRVLADGTTIEYTAADVKRGIPDIGFIAQDLVAAEDSIKGHDWLQLTLRNNPEKLEATQGRLIPILVKAVQELSAEVESLKQQLG